ncbi:MAG: hypothetical protein HYT75_02910 [Deltaproteobacteria bacterium]|nr:hypothetical protein [Deltaproteobacteria bacterium]MBI2341163.1 hypothetical protein [Deltaproteobacteria bacterium]
MVDSLRSEVVKHLDDIVKERTNLQNLFSQHCTAKVSAECSNLSDAITELDRAATALRSVLSGKGAVPERSVSHVSPPPQATQPSPWPYYYPMSSGTYYHTGPGF